MIVIVSEKEYQQLLQGMLREEMIVVDETLDDDRFKEFYAMDDEIQEGIIRGEPIDTDKDISQR